MLEDLNILMDEIEERISVLEKEPIDLMTVAEEDKHKALIHENNCFLVRCQQLALKKIGIDVPKATEWIKFELERMEKIKEPTPHEEGQIYQLKILKQWLK